MDIWEKPAVHLLVDARPGFVGEGDLRELIGGRVATDRLQHVHVGAVGVAGPLADEDAADFYRLILSRVLLNSAVDGRVEKDAERRAPTAGERRLRQVLLGQLADVGG
jgi:hypothetical protein